MNKFTRIKQTLASRQQQQLYRKPRIADSAQQPHMHINGKPYRVFCSNDYLGLANHPAIVQAFRQAASDFGVGSGAAHLINGHSRPHQQLEEALAEFSGRDRALLFSTGYMANLGVISALMQEGDRVYQDRLNHASLLDAVKLSGARQIRFQHGATQHLRQRMQKQIAGAAMIVADGVFSMDGDLAPVLELAAIASDTDAWLMIDDAHGFGVLGDDGAGVLSQQGLTQDEVPILMGTLGKALGTAGAFVAGPHDLIAYLIQTARPYIYTTAQPPAVAAATLASLRIVQQESWRREHLQTLIRRFRAGASELGLNLMPSATPIQPLVIGDSGEALAMSKRLDDEGILVTAIRPPTVPKHSARLRVTLSAAHSVQDVEQLLAALARVSKHQIRQGQ